MNFSAISTFEPYSNTERLREQLARTIIKWTPEEGLQPSPIDGVDLIRSNTTTTCFSSVYRPSLCILVQGSKTVWLGDRKIVYGPLTYLASSVDLPITGQVTEASPDKPYLAIRLDVDPHEVSSLVLEMGNEGQGEDLCPEGACGMCMAQSDDAMLGAFTRLVSLLDTPGDRRVLAPLARREILYRALMGEMGPRMRKFAASNTQAHRIAKVIALLKTRFSQPLRISELAEEVNMSESSLFHSFKEVTRMSPLQFQKKLRLHEAQRLMLSEGLEAATASYRVGYESPSHFSREYSRLFGESPRANVVKLRGAQQAVTVQA